MKALNRLVGLLSLAAASITGQVEGDTFCSDLSTFQCSPPNCSCLQGVEVFGQALYWKYTGTTTAPIYNFGVTIAPNIIKQSATYYNYDAQWGYRVGLGWIPNHCFYSELSYLRLYKRRNVEGIGGVTGSFNNNFLFTSGEIGVEYQNIDLTIGANVYRWKRLTMQLYGGGRWLFLQETADLNPQTFFGVAYIHDRSKYNAGAFKLGAGAYLQCGCLKVFGAIDALATIGVQRSGFTHLEPEAPSAALAFRPPENDTLNVATGMGSKLGLKYDCACRYWTFSAELAYEIQNYFDALRPTLRPADAAGAFSFGDAGFGGPYGSLKVGY